MLTFSLQSGSNGNCIYVEAGGVRLVFDAGISGKCAQQRMVRHGRSMDRVDAVIISHDHGDHTRCAGVFARKFKLPLHMTARTHAVVRDTIGPLEKVHHFTAGDTLCFGDVRVHTVPTPHDAVDGVAFVVEHAGTRLGILTDLGHPFRGLRELMATLHACYIESNYDPEMLRNGPYPIHLQQRIRGEGGHLSNEESADLLDGLNSWRWAALSHLSEHNNHPEVALRTHRRRHGSRIPLHVAGRAETGPLLEV